jgi:hypothetical protein
LQHQDLLAAGVLCVLNSVCGAQRTSAVLTPSSSCSGITDNPGTRPGRHAALVVSGRAAFSVALPRRSSMVQHFTHAHVSRSS